MGRRFRRRPPAWFYLAALLSTAVILRAWLTPSSPRLGKLPANCRVEEVSNGRALAVIDDVTGVRFRLRLLGVKAADETSARTWLAEQLIGRTLRLEEDRRRRDSDGAMLAYAYLDDRFVNAELIAAGVATYDPYPGDSASHAKLLREAAGR
jgi:endonuclease YncB( thermonuclease family)